MKKLMFALCLIVSPLLAASAMADCTYPKPPDNMPNGATASKDEMVAAMAAYKQYNSDVDAYTTCLDQETADKVKEAAGAGAIMQIKAIQSKKRSSAIDERQAKIEEFNKQIRTFKAKG